MVKEDLERLWESASAEQLTGLDLGLGRTLDIDADAGAKEDLEVGARERLDGNALRRKEYKMGTKPKGNRARGNGKINCPYDHPLQAFRVNHHGFECQACGESVPPRVTIFGCQACDYDICYSCYRDGMQQARGNDRADSSGASNRRSSEMGVQIHPGPIQTDSSGASNRRSSEMGVQIHPGPIPAQAPSGANNGEEEDYGGEFEEEYEEEEEYEDDEEEAEEGEEDEAVTAAARQFSRSDTTAAVDGDEEEAMKRRLSFVQDQTKRLEIEVNLMLPTLVIIVIMSRRSEARATPPQTPQLSHA
jgi:hypothetical protein